jgi:hypothetical protein
MLSRLATDDGRSDLSKEYLKQGKNAIARMKRSTPLTIAKKWDNFEKEREESARIEYEQSKLR